MERALNIVHLFPDLLNLYGDAGNILVLKKRCKLRNIDVNVTIYSIDDEIDLKTADIVILGGGEDTAMKIVNDKLKNCISELKEYRDSDGILLSLCGGYKLIGNYYVENGEKIEGLGLCDFYSVENEKRFTGNVCVDTPFGVIVGFENHDTKTYIGENSMPFGKVIRGFGNNGEDKTEGIVYKNFYGTYLHGPVLPKNPEFADALIRKALARKYDEESSELTEIDDELGKKAKAYILNLKKDEL